MPCPRPASPCSLLGNLSRNFPPRRPTRCASPPRCFVARAARTWPLSLQRCAGFSSCAGRCASRCAPQTRTSFSTCSPRWPRCSRRRWVRRWPSSCSSAARRLSRREEVLGARAEDTEEESCAQASSEGGRRSAYSLFGAHCANGAALPHLSLEQAAGAATSPVKSPTASEVRTEQAAEVAGGGAESLLDPARLESPGSLRAAPVKRVCSRLLLASQARVAGLAPR